MKKIALFLCFVMLFTASTFAASTNSVSREGGAYKEYTPLGFMTFNIRPLDEVTTGSSIILLLKQQKFLTSQLLMVHQLIQMLLATTQQVTSTVTMTGTVHRAFMM